jgi:hypothetical protein
MRKYQWHDEGSPVTIRYVRNALAGEVDAFKFTDFPHDLRELRWCWW